MTSNMGGYSPPSTTSTDPTMPSTTAYGSSTGMSSTGGSSTTDVVKDEAMGVGESVKEAGGHVAQTAAEQVREVAAETTQQARDLMNEGRQQLRQQTVNGQQKAAQGLSSIADELRQMADGGSQSGVASEVARQAADRVQTMASWLQEREPGDLLDEVRAFARRRPGAFLLGAALAGVVAGRLTGSAVAMQREWEDRGPAPDDFTTQPISAVGQPADYQSSTGYAMGAGTGYGTGVGTSTGYGTGTGAGTGYGMGTTSMGTGMGTEQPPAGGPPNVPAPGSFGPPPAEPYAPYEGDHDRNGTGTGYGSGGQVNR